MDQADDHRREPTTSDARLGISQVTPPVQREQDDQHKLSIEKLELEIASLESKRGLESEKLRHEVSELRKAPRRALLTIFFAAITPLLVAGVGGYISYQLHSIADRQHDADSYERLLQDLGSASAPAREAAVIGLSQFARHDPDRSAPTVTILTTQLAEEPDPGVLRVLLPTLVSIGRPALDEVVRANRSASITLLRSCERFVSLSMPALEKYEKPEPRIGSTPFRIQLDAWGAYGNIARQMQPVLNPDLLNESEQETLEKIYFPDGMFFSEEIGIRGYLSSIFFYFCAGEDKSFGLFRNLLGDMGRTTEGRGDANVRDRELAKIREETVASARAVLVSALVINRTIRLLNRELKFYNLNSVFLPIFDARNLELPETEMSGSFLAGNATDAKFLGAKFNYARISLLQIDNSDFSYATLNDAWMPCNNFCSIHSRDWRKTYLGSIRLAGANWWDTANVKSRGGTIRVSAEGESTFKLELPSDEERAKTEKANFEEAFPREQNEAARKNWLKRSK